MSYASKIFAYEPKENSGSKLDRSGSNLPIPFMAISSVSLRSIRSGWPGESALQLVTAIEHSPLLPINATEHLFVSTPVGHRTLIVKASTNASGHIPGALLRYLGKVP